ncbi:MAG TPA: amino acid adenylation domain-containing protein, partial [Thermoanaerobaculia bacterium]|nr:amino acid adenylation domain-containing protein [Thermoanaerobaculia bacterium]
LDSLAAAELQGFFESELKVAIGMAELLAGPTLAELADTVVGRVGGVEGPRAHPAPAAGPEEGAAGFPLSHGQRALWFLDRLEPGNPAYNIAAAARVRPDLDTGALCRAFDLLAGRHQALRLRFAETSAGPLQAETDRPVDFREADARGWSAEKLAGRLAAAAAQPFDLALDPLLRVVVLRTGEAEHTVLLVVHHIVADLWSLAVIVRELAEIYPLLKAGAVPALPPAPRFTDHVRHQAERLAGEAGEALFDYWHERLHGEPAVLELPTDRPRPPVQTFHGAALSRQLPPGLLEAARALARREGTTLYGVLLAGFGALLGRTAGQERLLVGSPTAGRGPAALADLVGYLVNPVPLGVALDGRPSFAGLLAAVRSTILAAFRHQDLPFPLLVERLRPQRDASRSPLFQVMLVLQQSHLRELGDLGAFALGEEGVRLELGGLDLTSCRLAQRHAQFDLELMAAEAGRTLSLRLIYNPDLFDGTTAGRLLDHLGVLLAGALDDPARTVAELPWLTGAERRQLLAEWNDTALSLPLDSNGGERGFGALFAEQVARTPGAPAVSGQGRVLTYAELDLAAGRLAHGLLAAGLRPEEPVAVLALRGPDFLAAMLAIWRAGGAYLPLDPRQPARRLAQMIHQSGARRILAMETTESVASATGAPGGAQILSLERLLAAPSPGGRLPAPPAPGQLAYVLFTSGSTGTPKGAMVEQRGMLNHLLAKVRDLGLDATDRVAQNAAPTFDISVWQFLAALLVGGVVEVIPDELASDPACLLAEVDRRRVTVLETVPSLLASVLAEPVDGPGAPRLSSLRWLVPTGEALPPDLCRLWLERFPGVPLLNAYGPTECSDDVSHQALHTALPPGATSTPIGRPVVNTRLHLLDRELALVPLGSAGEICVAGDGVGRGYVGDPARTAAVFVPDPYSPEPGGRLYRTGDLGRRRPDGALEFHGRLDDQVKVRGFRIEPGEIEAAFAEHPGVTRAVVVARPDPRGEERLVAYWAAADNITAPADADFKELLRQRLPEAMIPTAFVRLDPIPLTAHGKVDRRALPEPDWTGSAGTGRPLAPRDEVEELLAGFFAEVLGREAVGLDDDFFELGGHSLLATQVASRVRRALGIDLPLSHLFAAPTVSGLAARVRQERGGPALTPPVRLPRDGALPLSFGQQRLWLLGQLEPESAAYNMPGVVRLEGHLAPGLLAAALAATVRRHEALRTVFREEGGVPRQEILADPLPALPVIDLAGLPEPARAALARRLAAEDAARPFDLSRWPLLRAGLLRLAAEEHLLLVTLHHIVSDGWSQGIFVREISAGYFGLARGAAPALPALPLQYADFARWQVTTLAGDLLAAELGYWRERLAGSPPPLALPLDRPRPPRQSYRGARRRVRIAPATTAALRRFTRGQGATLFMGLFAAFSTLLARLAGQSGITVGTPVANRRWPELEGLIGFFVNTLVLRAELGGEVSLAGLLPQAREVALGAYAHQDLPFERLVEELEPERDLSRSPLFQAMLGLENAPAARLTLPGLTLALAEIDNGTAKFDLTLALEEDSGDGLSGYLEYASDLFDGVTAERFAQRFELLLDAALAAPQRPLAELPLLAAAERQALAEWNDTAAPLPQELSIHEWIERQSEGTPDAVALSFEEESLTYGERERRANRLA